MVAPIRKLKTNPKTTRISPIDVHFRRPILFSLTFMNLAAKDGFITSATKREEERTTIKV